MSEPSKVIDLKTSARPKILVAEDEQDIASLIEDWLSESFDVTVALNGKTAIQKAVWHQPQAILLDVVMPDMGGYDVVRLLQGTPQTKEIPVIVMTAKNFDDSTIKLIKTEGNVYGFLNKPFKPSELIKMLEVVLKGGRIHTPEIQPSPAPTFSVTEPARDLHPSGFDVVKTGQILGVESTREKGEVNITPGESSSSLPEKRQPEKAVINSKPRKEKPKEKEDADVPLGKRKLVLSLGKWAFYVFSFGVLLFSAAEWACRKSENVLGSHFFAPPLYPSSRFNSFLPYQWRDAETSPLSFWDDGHVLYQFNQWGLRGADFPLVAPVGVRRILLLGGTSTFGMGVSEKETISSRLETVLNEKNPTSHFQVINGGLWAFSPEEQWAFVKGQGFNFKPEIILWLCEPRAPGEPSTEGLRWLADHRWMVSAPLTKFRLLQMLAQEKIRGDGDPSPKEGDLIFREAEKAARDQKVALIYWVLPRDSSALAKFHEGIMERLSSAVEKKKE